MKFVQIGFKSTLFFKKGLFNGCKVKSTHRTLSMENLIKTRHSSYPVTL